MEPPVWASAGGNFAGAFVLQAAVADWWWCVGLWFIFPFQKLPPTSNTHEPAPLQPAGQAAPRWPPTSPRPPHTHTHTHTHTQRTPARPQPPTHHTHHHQSATAAWNTNAPAQFLPALAHDLGSKTGRTAAGHQTILYGTNSAIIDHLPKNLKGFGSLRIPTQT